MNYKDINFFHYGLRKTECQQHSHKDKLRQRRGELTEVSSHPVTSNTAHHSPALKFCDSPK